MLTAPALATKQRSDERWRLASARGKLPLMLLISSLASTWAPPAWAEACPPPPPAVTDIDIPRFYADDAGSIVDEAKAREHKAAVEPLTAFLRHVTSDADKAWKRSKPSARAEAGACAAGWLDAWATGGALLGKMTTKQAEYQRKWDLAGSALAYIKAKPYATDEQRQRIEAWLVKLADACAAFFDDKDRKRNNHWYWMGLAAGAVGIGANSSRNWDLAHRVMRDAVADIGADGTLHHELDRRARALHYHAFAVMPLIALAELAAARNEDFYALGNGALHRLAQTTIAELRDPAVFDKLVGEAQERPTRPGAGWMQIYAARFPDRMQGTLPESSPGHRWLGGDVAVLREALASM